MITRLHIVNYSRSGSQIQAWTIMVVGGQLELNKPTSTSQKRGVDKIYVHPQFEASTLQNDVAILVVCSNSLILLFSVIIHAYVNVYFTVKCTVYINARSQRRTTCG